MIIKLPLVRFFIIAKEVIFLKGPLTISNKKNALPHSQVTKSLAYSLERKCIGNELMMYALLSANRTYFSETVSAKRAFGVGRFLILIAWMAGDFIFNKSINRTCETLLQCVL
jgi:hypothetical protein